MEQTRENKMGSMPLGKLIITMSLPIMISMLVQALYNVVDSIFVARISENALTAVSMAFPIQNLMIAIGSGTAVGVNALLSRALGAKQFERVNRIAENAVILAAGSFVLFLLIGIFGVRPFFAVQTDIAEIVECGTSYLTICCCLSLGVFYQLMFERLLQSTGKTLYTMITQGTGAIINIILDPILIFGLCGMPRMGVSGAAVATVAGQTVAGIMAIWLNHKKNVEVNIQMKGFRPDGGLILEIYKIGIPSVIMMAIGSVMTFGMNQILLGFSFIDGSSGIWCIFQAAELYLYACVRTEQRYHSGDRLQLRRRKQEACDRQREAGAVLRGCDHGVRSDPVSDAAGAIAPSV